MAKVCIVGGANIDICGTSDAPLKAFDSNPGKIDIQFGGVGRNIAEVLCHFGQEVRFVTCFSNDFFGRELKKDCETLGMDCNYSKVVDHYPSSTYLAILNNDRDMNLAMSDMRILEELDLETLECAIRDLTDEDLLLLDGNLDETRIQYLTQHASCRIASDPVSVSKGVRLLPYLNKIAIFKPNELEASSFSGIAITDSTSARQCLQWFLDKGISEIVISMAEKGVLVGTKEKMTWYHHRKVELENANGGGDAFFGAYLAQRMKQHSIQEAITYAITSAILKIEQRPWQTEEEFQSYITTMDIEGEQL